MIHLDNWHRVVGGVTATYLRDHGRTANNPALDDDDCAAAVRTVQADLDQL